MNMWFTMGSLVNMVDPSMKFWLNPESCKPFAHMLCKGHHWSRAVGLQLFLAKTTRCNIATQKLTITWCRIKYSRTKEKTKKNQNVTLKRGFGTPPEKHWMPKNGQPTKEDALLNHRISTILNLSGHSILLFSTPVYYFHTLLSTSRLCTTLPYSSLFPCLAAFHFPQLGISARNFI
jgi:hypothetical protein